MVLCVFVLQSAAQPIHIAPYRGDKECAISYTFDDGLEEHYTVLFPRLKQLGFKATFWIWGKGIEHPEYQQGKPRMTWRQMKEMVADGQEISSHSWSHPNRMPQLSDAEIKEELYRNDTCIYHHLGVKPLSFAYPSNTRDERVIRLASEGRVGTRTSEFSVGEDYSHITPDKLRTWVRQLKATHGWGVTRTHGITKGWDYFHDPSILWNHLREVKAQEDSIWVATFSEVAAYIKEQKNTKLSIQPIKGGYEVTPSLNLDKNLFKEPLTLVISTEEKRVRVVQDGKRLPLTCKKGETLAEFNPYGGHIFIRY